jgi:hypothetical protein
LWYNILMNKRAELFKWFSDIGKTASWIGSAILSYFNIPHGGLWFAGGTFAYFIGMQFIAFTLHIKYLDEMED